MENILLQIIAAPVGRAAAINFTIDSSLLNPSGNICEYSIKEGYWNVFYEFDQTSNDQRLILTGLLINSTYTIKFKINGVVQTITQTFTTNFASLKPVYVPYVTLEEYDSLVDQQFVFRVFDLDESGKLIEILDEEEIKKHFTPLARAASDKVNSYVKNAIQKLGGVDINGNENGTSILPEFSIFHIKDAVHYLVRDWYIGARPNFERLSTGSVNSGNITSRQNTYFWEQVQIELSAHVKMKLRESGVEKLAQDPSLRVNVTPEEFVRVKGLQTITGEKIFSKPVKGVKAINDDEFVIKSQMDFASGGGNFVTIDTDQIILGKKTFTQITSGVRGEASSNFIIKDQLEDVVNSFEIEQRQQDNRLEELEKSSIISGALESPNGAIITTAEQQITTNAVQETPSLMPEKIDWDFTTKCFIVKESGRFILNFNGSVGAQGTNQRLTLRAKNFSSGELLKEGSITIPSNFTQINKFVTIDIPNTASFPFTLAFYAFVDSSQINFTGMQYNYTFTTGNGAGATEGNYVTIDTAQEITGQKVFRNFQTIGVAGIHANSFTTLDQVTIKDENILDSAKNYADQNFVGLVGDNTISGIKTFTSPVKGVEAVNADEFVVKSQVESISTASGNLTSPGGMVTTSQTTLLTNATEVIPSSAPNQVEWDDNEDGFIIKNPGRFGFNFSGNVDTQNQSITLTLSAYWEAGGEGSQLDSWQVRIISTDTQVDKTIYIDIDDNRVFPFKLFFMGNTDFSEITFNNMQYNYTHSRLDNPINYVTTDTNQTITGQKTFSLPVIGVEAVNDNEFATKSQIGTTLFNASGSDEEDFEVDVGMGESISIPLPRWEGNVVNNITNIVLITLYLKHSTDLNNSKVKIITFAPIPQAHITFTFEEWLTIDGLTHTQFNFGFSTYQDGIIIENRSNNDNWIIFGYKIVYKPTL